MKKLLAILAVAVACTALACEKKSDEVIRPTKFDRDLDGPPSRLGKPLNEDIAKDQRRIAREAGRAVAPVGSPPATPAPGAPAGGGSSEEVKQIVARMMTTIKPGQEEKALDFLDPQEASAIRPLFKSIQQIGAKVKQLEKLVQTKLGAALPESMKGGGGEPPEPLPGMPKDFAKIRFDDIQFKEEGEEVAVTGPQGLKMRFAKVGADWKMKLPPEAKLLIQTLRPMFEELLGSFNKVVDEMTAGVNDGSITKDNLEARSEELQKKHVGPVMEKFFEAMMKDMQPPGAPLPDTSL